ncbi:MAG TPA: hypothetical protein VE422_00905 [Terriglobia bacterium]|nr:hypothetical protein [Terriglobia bacterium]
MRQRGSKLAREAHITPINPNAKTAPIERRQRLGGLLNYYYREAA